MAAAHNTNLVDENNTTQAPALVHDIIYIYDNEVEELTSDTVKYDKISTDVTIKTERDKINNEENSSLEEDESYSDDEVNDNIPL